MRRNVNLRPIAYVLLATGCLTGCEFFKSILGLGETDETDTNPPIEMPRDGLVAEWLFSGNALDTSDSAVSSTVIGASLATDPLGITETAYYFNGASYISYVSPIPTGTTAFSISLWLYTEVLDAQRLAVYLSPLTGETHIGLSEQQPTRLAFCTLLPGFGFFTLLSNDDLETGTWYHIVGVFKNRISGQLWIDGVLDSAADAPPYDLTAYPEYSGWESAIGSYTPFNLSRFWKGTIDNVRLYNRALTDTEVATLYSEQSTGDDDATTPPPTGTTFAVTAPNGGEHWETSTAYLIRWSTTLASPTVYINLTKSGTFFRRITDSTANSGSYSWTVPSDIEESTAYSVTIKTLDNSGEDQSDSNFTITTKPFIKVTRPNGGEAWGCPYTKVIEWMTANAGANVKIELYHSGTYEGTIVSSTPNDGSYDWDVDCNHPVASNPDRLEAFYKVKIISTSTPSISDMSDASFEIWD